MRFYILCVLLIFNYLPVFAESRTVVVQQPYLAPPAIRGGYNNNYVADFSDLDAIENYLLNKTYPKETIVQRLQRLENTALGAVQDGDISRRYETVRSAILARPKPVKQSLKNSLSNYINGQLTGFSPSLNSFNNPAYQYYNNPSYFSNNFNTVPFGFFQNKYPSTYNSGRTNFYGTNPFNYGYRNHEYSTGSNTGVHILD